MFDSRWMKHTQQKTVIFVCLLSVNEVCDSLLKAGYMGTMLVISEASYLDSEDDASSVNKTTGLTETCITHWGYTSRNGHAKMLWCFLYWTTVYLEGTGSRRWAGCSGCRWCSSDCDQLTLWSRLGYTEHRGKHLEQGSSPPEREKHIWYILALYTTLILNKPERMWVKGG